MKEQRKPTQSEIEVVHALCLRWPEVLENELRGRFDERRDDAASMLREYLLTRACNYLDRYLPDRSPSAGAVQLVKDLDAVVREPRAAFRMWVRSMVRWVCRDWARRRKLQGELLEVPVLPDGRNDDRRGLTFDRLAVSQDSEPERHFDVDHARDVVARLMEEAPAELQDDITLFLAAEEAGPELYRAYGTSRAAVLSRLAGLRPQAHRVVAEVGAWAG